MDVSAIFRAILAPDQERAPEQLARLKVGDRLTGRVLKMEEDGRLLIDLGRFKALADTNLPVQVGQRLTLRVTQMGTPIQLRLEPQTQPAVQALPPPRMAVATLLAGGDQQRMVNAIDRLLNAMPAPSQGASSAQAAGGRAMIESAPSTASAMELPAPSVAGLDRGHLPEAVRHALVQLKAIFDPMPLEAPAAQRTQWVQANVEDRGILFELKMADALSQTSPPPATTLPANAGAPPAPADHPTETLMDLSITPAAKGAMEVKTGLDAASANIVATEGEPPAGIDPRLALGIKVQAGAHAENDAAVPKNSVVLPAPDAQAAEEAQRIIARDLKPHLLIVKNFLTGLEERLDPPLDAHAKDVALLRQVVNQLTDHVAQQQEQAVRRSGEPDLYQVFTHLLPVKDQQQPVQLKVYYPKKGRPAEADPQHRVSLLLMLDRLGPVRVDLGMVERSLRIGFYVRDASVQQIFEKHGQAVVDGLADAFDHIQISTQVSKEKIAQFEGEDLMGPPVGRIDVQV